MPKLKDQKRRKGVPQDRPIPKAKPSNTDTIDGATIRRLMAYIGKNYRFRFTAVVIFIIISSIVGAISSLFIGRVVDDFITPAAQTVSSEFRAASAHGHRHGRDLRRGGPVQPAVQPDHDHDLPGHPEGYPG
jgi:hypothetical protein